MFRKVILIFFILINTYIYSLESSDKLISQGLVDIFGDDIKIDQINKVLEFDESNRDALIKKAQLYDNSDSSLHISKDILKNIKLESLESKLQYISILYRLNEYKEIIKFTDQINIDALNSSKTLYYIADSFLRENNLLKAKEIIDLSIHQFPSEAIFLELLYLTNYDKNILSKLTTFSDPLQSYIRLYNRVKTSSSALLLEVFIERYLIDVEVSELNSYIGNYEVLKPLFKVKDITKLNGLFKLDIDGNTFPDTIFKVNDGIIQYKGFDRDSDNIIDYEIFLEDKTPKSVVIDGTILSYSNYPYIDYISLLGEERVTYDLYKNYTVKTLTNLLTYVDLEIIVKKLPKLKLLSKTYYIGDKIDKKYVYKDLDTVLLFSELNKQNDFDKCLYIKNDEIIAGLKDLDSDGIFDLSEVYNLGKLVGYAYSETGQINDISHIETYGVSDEYIMNNADFRWLED